MRVELSTTNPPGNERACIEYIAELVRDAGLEVVVKSRDPDRPNFVAGLRGRGEQTPRLVHGHVDVVPQTTHGNLTRLAERSVERCRR